MFAQKKDKEASNVELTRKKMLILTALEDKIKHLIKKVEDLTDKTALTSDASTLTENYNVLIEQTRELLSIYFKVRAMGESSDNTRSNEMSPLKEQVDMLEKQFHANAESILQGSNLIVELKSELIILSNTL